MFHQLAALLCAITVTASAEAIPAHESATLPALLQETNAAHALIDAPRDSLDSYRYQFDNGKPLLTVEDGALLRAYDPDVSIDHFSAGEARQEVQWIFRLLRTQYGLYTLSGGDAAFEKAETAILNALPQTGTLSTADYQALLVQHLSFVQDTHFMIGDHNFAPDLILFSNESRPYYSKNGKFYTDAACTVSIDTIGGQPPATYLKRAIGQDGELTFYPYTLAPRADTLPLLVSTSSGNETLQLSPAVSFESREKPEEKYRFSIKDGIPFLELREMIFGDDDQSGWSNLHDESDKQAFLASVSQVKKYPAAVIDLSHNPGGNGDLPLAWFQAYTGQQAQPNYCTLRIRHRDTWLRIAYGADETQTAPLLETQDAMYTAAGFAASGGYYAQYPSAQFVPNDGPVLFVLTSRGTASAAEGFTDVLHNLQNVVTIGTNTGGVLSNGANYGLTLPYSGLAFQFGECLFYWDPAYFREGYGIAPDLYLTGENLDQRLSRFLARYSPNVGS